MSSFWKKVVSSKDPSSAKRLLTLIVAGHFVLAGFTALFLFPYLVFYLPKGRVDTELIDLLKTVLEYDMTIILGGLGIIGAENLANAWVERAKIKTEAIIQPLDPTQKEQTNIDTEKEKID